MRARAWAPLFVMLACAPPAAAQDFAAPAPGGARGPHAFLEHALPPAQPLAAFEAQVSTRWGIPELTTRSLAGAAGAGALRAAAGLSQTGDPEIGWTAVALAAGAAGRDWGAGFCVTGRRDRHPAPPPSDIGAGIGLAAGAGAWMRLTSRVLVWVSAPQAWTHGAPPPLLRGLHAGASLRWPALRLWGEHESLSPELELPAVHTLGIEMPSAPFVLWLRARDSPLRAAMGVSAAVHAGEVRVEAESHPVLGETVRLALRIGARDGDAP